MRPGAEFSMSHGAPTAAPAHAALNGTAPHSPWQSPVPYLFGGLAAMLGLIAFALLILACSYWKLSGYLDGGSDSGADQAGSAGGDDGEKGSASGAARPAVEFQEHVVVIMAGDERPTFLAKPATSRAVVELGAAPAATARGDDNDAGASGQVKKQVEDEHQQGSETVTSPPQPRADAAGAASRSHESRSSSTTALQESSQ